MIKLVFSMLMKKRSVFAGTLAASILAAALLTLSGTLLFTSIHGLIHVKTVDYTAAVSIFGVIAGMTLFAAVFVLRGTITFAVRQRFSDLALLRGIGLLPSQLAQMLRIEAVCLSLAGFLFGVPIGTLLTPAVSSVFISLNAIPKDFTIQYSSFVILCVFVLGLMTLLLSSQAAVQRVSRLSPAEAMGSGGSKRFHWGNAVSIVLFTGGGIAILLAVPMEGAAGIGYNFLASICLIIGLSSCVEAILRFTAYVLSVFSRNGLFSLAAGNIRAKAPTLTAAVNAIMLLIALNGGILINSFYFNSLAINPVSAQQTDSNVSAQNAVLLVMVVITLLFSIIGIFNTFAISAASRTGEFKKLRLIGLTKNQILRMTAIETRIMCITGGGIGAVIVSLCVGFYTRAQSPGVYRFIAEPDYYFGLIFIGVGTGLLAGFLSSGSTMSKKVRNFERFSD